MGSLGEGLSDLNIAEVFWSTGVMEYSEEVSSLQYIVFSILQHSNTPGICF